MKIFFLIISAFPIIIITSCDIIVPSEEIDKKDLFKEMWHLKNIGQKSYAKSEAVSGIDLNLPSDKYNGKNIKILIADDAVDLKHPDLIPNALINGSIDLYNDPLNPTSYIPITQNTETHGTKVAGVIAAAKNKNNKFRGIAYSAKIGSANLFEKANSIFSYTTLQMLMYDFAYNQNFDIINQSYGENPFVYSSISSSNSQVINELIKNNYRKNTAKGFIIVTSSGNYTCEFKYADKYTEMNGKKSSYETTTNIKYDNLKNLKDYEKKYLSRIRPHFSLFDWKKSTPYTIVVGALSANGIIAEYSSIGSNLWITGFGGGELSRKTEDNNFNSDSIERPKIITTTIPGRIGFGNLFDNGFLTENKNLYYSSTFTGTSAAAPTISGVIALILSSNPKLSFWDIKHILAKTASNKKIEPNPKPYYIKVIENLNLFDTSNSLWSVWKNNWITNAAGYHFSNFYGFGVVNTNEAVNYALNYDYPYQGKLLSNYVIKNYNIQKIINEGSFDYPIEIKIDKNIKIQAINIYPVIETNKSDGIGIEIESPQHTKSVVLYPANSLISSNTDDYNNKLKYPGNNSKLADDNIGFLSNAFYEEDAKGTWRVKVINANKKELDQNNQVLFKGIKFEILGFSKN